MKQKTAMMSAVAVAALALCFLHPARAITPGSPSSQPMLAPDFTLPALTGERFQLSHYRGKVVLLDFWATWCGPCRKEIPYFAKLQKNYRSRGLQVIAISMDDSPEPVRNFCNHIHLNYPVVMGNPNLGELYGGVLGLPVAFLIARDGSVYRKHSGAIEPAVLEKEIEDLLRASH